MAEPDKTPKPTDAADRLDMLVRRRDSLIRELWIVYRDISNIMDVDDFDPIDLDLLVLVTKHGAVQSRLDT